MNLKEKTTMLSIVSGAASEDEKQIEIKERLAEKIKEAIGT